MESRPSDKANNSTNILSVAEICKVIDRFLNLEAIKNDASFQELASITKTLNQINADQALASQPDTRDALSNQLCILLNRLMNEERFYDIKISDTSFGDALYCAALTLADIHPVNNSDFITLEPIDPAKRIVTSDRYQHDIDSLVNWLRRNITNPYTNLKFHARDLTYIQKQHALRYLTEPVEFNQHQTHPGGDPDLEATLALVRQFQLPPWQREVARARDDGHTREERRMEAIRLAQIQLAALQEWRPQFRMLAEPEGDEDINIESSHSLPTGVYRRAGEENDQPIFFARSAQQPQHPRLFNHANSNSVMMRVIQASGNQITRDHFKQWPANKELTNAHADAILYLIAMVNLPPSSAIDFVKDLSGDQAKNLASPQQETRSPRPGSPDDLYG